MAGAKPLEQNLSGRRVLVVEDEYFIADDLARALSRAGAEVVGPAPTCDEALQLAGSTELDAAILDINLAGEEVFAVADLLIEKGVPILFATGYHDTLVPARYRHVPRWEKPFDPASVARVLPALA